MSNEEVERAIEFILNHQANIEIRQQKMEEQQQRTEEQQQQTEKRLQDLADQISKYVKATEMRFDEHTTGLERLLEFIDEQKEINIKLYENSKRVSQTQIILAEVQKQSIERQDKLEERQGKLEDNMANLANAINNLASSLSKNGGTSQS